MLGRRPGTTPEGLPLEVRPRPEASAQATRYPYVGSSVTTSAQEVKDIVILDEPTAALGVAQSGMVLELMQRVRDRGATVIFISHNLPHIYQVADRMIVLRNGRRVGTLLPSASMDEAVSLMTGATSARGAEAERTR